MGETGDNSQLKNTARNKLLTIFNAAVSTSNISPEVDKAQKYRGTGAQYIIKIVFLRATLHFCPAVPRYVRTRYCLILTTGSK